MKNHSSTSQTNLVTLEDHEGEMRISSRDLAEGVGVQHKATFTLIKKHKKRLESFGSLEFKIPARSKTGQEKHAFLNEDQAIFLITLSRNTEQVVEFKHALVTAFSKLRRKQALIDANHAKAEWQQNRMLGKLKRKGLFDTILTFTQYAEAQNSRRSKMYFMAISKCVNAAISQDGRDNLSEHMLAYTATAERMAEGVLRAGMSRGIHYKKIYQNLKKEMDIFGELVNVTEFEIEQASDQTSTG